MNDRKRFAPATARNREAILDVLREWIAPGAAVLEIASGTGEHAVFLAPRLEVASWQPTDPEADSRASIDAWRDESGVETVRPSLALDVTQPWPAFDAKPDAIVCVNMIHISPWGVTSALFDGASAALSASGVLYLYGPYKRDGRHTSPSNESFDASLRARNAEWGVRDLGDVTLAARARGFELARVTEMPANNLSVIFTRGPT